jgi:hypothetical protein
LGLSRLVSSRDITGDRLRKYLNSEGFITSVVGISWAYGQLWQLCCSVLQRTPYNWQWLEQSEPISAPCMTVCHKKNRAPLLYLRNRVKHRIVAVGLYEEEQATRAQNPAEYDAGTGVY